MFRFPLSELSLMLWEKLICKDKIFSVVSILFKFPQLLPWMWRGNRDYLLCLWISVLERIETIFLRLAEGTACSWTSSAPWLRHQNAERGRRNKQRYRDVSWENATTVWRTISIFCKILPFFCVWTYTYIHTYIFNIFFLRFPLALCSGHRFRDTLTNWLKPWLQRKHHLYVY